MRYIGSKQNLLLEIADIIEKNIQGKPSPKTFLDLFGGTNSVGVFFKDQYTVFSNDLLFFSFVNAKAVIENNGSLGFKKLKKIGIQSPIDYLQEHAQEYLSKNIIGYYERNYTPTGDVMYLSVENGKRIDFIRDQIDLWRTNELLSDPEYYYLISVLIEAIPFVSNITGVYGAFLKHWDKRALKSLELKPLVIKDNQKPNKAHNQDANQLIKEISVDIAYIDTPYNSRQYASNYHLLENVARNNKPELRGKTKIFEWSNLKSDYASKINAKKAMSELIQDIDATHIILSYNNEGIITEDELIALIQEHTIPNTIDVVRIPYRKYQSKITSKNLDLYELLIYAQKKPTMITPPKKAPQKQNVAVTSWSCETQKYIKSPLNYIGGKYKLLKQIIPLFPSKIETFIDLFSGGANVGINVDAKKIIFNDMNKLINEMFRYFADRSPDLLVDQIKARIKEYGLSKDNQEAYITFRKQYNANPNPLDLYVLVSYSYNFQFRFNNALEFNNPFGRDRSCFSQNMENNLRLFVNRLHQIDAQFSDQYFTDIDTTKLTSNDFVYLDPPYLITTGNYNDGNRGFKNWNETQEIELYNLLDRLTQQGVRFALSNVVTHKGKENKILQEYIARSKVHVHYLDFNYNNSSHNSKGTGSCEVLVTNYDPTTYELMN